MMIPDIDVNEKVNKPLKELIKPWALPPIKSYCFKNGSLIDVIEGKVHEGVSVFTEGGRISKIEGADALVPENFITIDCNGKYLSPGLFDNHVHLQAVTGETDLGKMILMTKAKALMRVAQNTEAMLKRGFTSLRDCGGAEAHVKEAINEGSIIGPRLFISGHAISQTGGHGHMVPGNLPGNAFDSCSCHLNPVSVIADGVDECYKASREELRKGADFIKIMAGGGVASPTDKISNTQFCEDELKALVRVAESFGTYVTAHAYTPQSIKNCLNCGVKGIEHGNLLDEETAALMRQKGCYLTPTLVTYKIMASDQFSTFLGPESKVKNAQVLKDGLRALLIAKRNKVKICYGSDLLGPLVGYQTQEFFIRGKVLSAQEILLSATVTPAEMSGVAHELGQIKVGYLADILVLEENPLQNIEILDEPEKNLKLIMKDGRIFHSDLPSIHKDVRTTVL